MSTPTTDESQKTHINVLSIDGGGMRGVIPSTYLTAIEEALGRPSHEIFHTIGGTSTGGILSVFLSVPGKTKDNVKLGKIKSAAEVTDFYRQYGKHIFPKKFWGLGKIMLVFLLCVIGIIAILSYLLRDVELHYVTHELRPSRVIARLAQENKALGIIYWILIAVWILSILGITHAIIWPEYSAKPMCKAVEDSYDVNTTLADAKTHVAVVSTDRRYVRPFVFNSVRAKQFPSKIENLPNPNKDIMHAGSLLNIVRSTSAAPTFFKPVLFTNDNPADVKLSTEWNSLDAPEYNWKMSYHQDGGCTKNNPSLEVLKLYRLARSVEGKDKDNDRVTLLSLTTGTMKEDPSIEPKKTIWSRFCCSAGNDGGLEEVIQDRLLGYSNEIDIKAYEDHCKAANKFSRGEGTYWKYFRPTVQINMHQANSMDDSSEANINSLVDATEKAIYKDPKNKQNGYTQEFQGIIEKLKLGLKPKTLQIETVKNSLGASELSQQPDNSQSPLSVSTNAKTPLIGNGSRVEVKVHPYSE